MTELPERTRLGSDVCVKARSLRLTFKTPEADWMPTGFLAYQGRLCGLLAIPPDLLDDAEGKDVLFGPVMREIAQSAHATSIAVVLSCWMLMAVGGESEAEVLQIARENRVHEHPERMEALVVTAADRDGIDTWWAPILRDGEQPPGPATSGAP